MRGFQDDYYEKVGQHFGLTRLGPGRRRLSTYAWNAEQAQAKLASKIEAVVELGHKKGYKKDIDYKYLCIEGGEHNQKTWSECMPDFLIWAFGTKYIEPPCFVNLNVNSKSSA